MLYEFTHEPRIAYFSMEIALRNEIPTYAGGLGMLAGDTVRSAADLHLPLVGVTLVSRAGYLRQEIDTQGRQIEHPSPWEPARLRAVARRQGGIAHRRARRLDRCLALCARRSWRRPRACHHARYRPRREPRR